MWTTTVLKCPDEGNAYQLVRVSEDGVVTVMKYVNGEELERLIGDKR